MRSLHHPGEEEEEFTDATDRSAPDEDDGRLRHVPHGEQLLNTTLSLLLLMGTTGNGMTVADVNDIAAS